MKFIKKATDAGKSNNSNKIDAIDKNNVFVSALGRITGAKAGSMGFGPPLVLAGLGGRIANKLIGGKTEQEVYQILSQAFMDKDFAAQLIKPVNDEIAGEIESSINRLLNDNNAVFTTGTRLGETQVEKLQNTSLYQKKIYLMLNIGL